jgi:hypothetical protein
MLWQDRETIVLDSGRSVHVPLGVVGLNMAADTVFAGDRPMVARDSCGAPGEPLTPSEMLDVARSLSRRWQELVANLEKPIKRPPGISGDPIDID